MIQGVLYCRVSDTEQREGFSIDSQARVGEEVARRHGIEIVRRWCVVESAKKEGRKAFSELVAFVKAHSTVKVLLFEKPDRMTRNFSDLVLLYDLVQRQDKELLFFTTGLRINKNSRSSEQFQLDIQVVLARNYINNLREEVMKGLTQKFLKGGFPSIAPTGYLNDAQTRGITLDARQAPLVRKLFELYGTGRYSLEEIAKIGQREGLEHPLKRKPIKKSGIYHILTNPFYYGLMKWNGQSGIGSHEPLISQALFERVQQVLGGQMRPRSRKFAFHGLAECGHCGSAITSEFHVKKQKNGVRREYLYYRCTGWRNGGKVCKGSYVSERELVEQLGEPLKNLTLDSPTVFKVKKALADSFRSEKEFHHSRLAALQTEATRIKGWLDKAYADRLEGVLTIEEYKEKAEAWRNCLVELQQEIRGHETADANYLDQGSRILELAQRAHELYERQPDNFEKRKMVDLVSSKVVISGGRVVLNLREPFSTLSKVAVAASSAKRGSEWWAVEDLNL